MIYYEYDYIVSLKHNNLLDNNFFENFSKLKKNDNYKIKIDVSKEINLKLNNLNNNNSLEIFNNISKYLYDNNIDIFLKSIINNSINQHNNLKNYIHLYIHFYKKNNNYNKVLINYCSNNITDINNKNKYIGSYLIISYLFVYDIILYEEFLEFFNNIFLEYDNYELILNSMLSIIDIVKDKLKNEILIKFRNRIEYISNNIKEKKLKFICMDILDII